MMYGTLTFGKGDKWSRAEFYASSAAYGRRQPACDHCRAARVKCRDHTSSDVKRCVRCYGANRPCTYSVARRQSTSAADSAGGSTVSGASNTHTRLRSCNKSFASGGGRSAASEQAEASSPKVPAAAEDEPSYYLPGLDMDTAVSSLGSQPVTLTSSTHNQYPFTNSTAERRYILSDSASAQFEFDVAQYHNNSSTTQGTDEGNNKLPCPASPVNFADFSDLIDIMQLQVPPPQSSDAGGQRPAAGTGAGAVLATPGGACICVQDLTATLFHLRSRTGTDVPVDQFLVLFKWAMQKWEAAETCPAACRITNAFSPLVLMNLQELNALLLHMLSTSLQHDGHIRKTTSAGPAGNGMCGAGPGGDEAISISIGAFPVDEEADQRQIVHALLTARVRELHLFIGRLVTDMRPGVLEQGPQLDDISAKLMGLMDVLKRVFVS